MDSVTTAFGIGDFSSGAARDLIRFVRDPVILTDAESAIVAWNPAAERIYGWSEGEALGRREIELLRTEFPDATRDAARNALRESGYFRGECIQCHRDGRRLRMECDSVALKSAAGNITGYLSFNRDVDERTAALDSSERQRGFMLTMADTLPGIIGYWTRDLRCGFANRLYREWFANAEADILGKSIEEVLGPDLYAKNKPSIAAVLEGRQQTFERHLVFPDGREWDTVVRYTPHVRDRKVEGFFVLMMDLTAQKHSEQRLMASLSVQNAITRNTAFGIIQTDREGRVQFWNPSAQSMLGYGETEAAQRNVLAFFPDAGEWSARAAAISGELGIPVTPGFEAMVIKSRLGLRNEFELTGTHKSGKRIPFLVGVTAIHGPDGGLSGYIATLVDLEERKRLEDELRVAKEAAEQASQAKSEFLATMSHEIRTPMNGVLGTLQVLSGTPLEARQRELLEVMRQSGELLLTVINDILDFSKIEAGRMEMNPTVFDAVAQMHDVIAMLRGQASAKGLTLGAEPGPATAYAWADRERFRQIAVNLISNAVKFTDQGGVSVRVADAGGVLRISVADTGCGIPDSKRGLLFQRFSQVDSSSTRKFTGTGLGLAISHGLVELMRGRMGFESEPGKGSVFWFELPVAEKAPPVAPAKVPDAGGVARGTPLPLQRLRVLVAEDNPVNQFVAQHMLENLDCDVTIANNGEEAECLVKEKRFDLVFMDCQMPGKDGLETTRAIRAWEEKQTASDPARAPRRLPIIALTAGVLEREREQCFACGMDDFLAKPMRPEDLEAKLQNYRTD